MTTTDNTNNTNNSVELILKEMLSQINIKFDTIDELVDTEILRSDILSEEICNYFQKYQKTLKTLGYKTGTLTSLHKNNYVKQKWPAINMLRQLLKCNNLHMKPFVKSDGYDKSSGKKKTIRYFIIKKNSN